MKILKNILAFIIILLLTVVYMIDRLILVLLPWLDVRPLQEWLPKSTQPEEVKKEFPYMSDEAIQEMVDTRKFMITVNRVSFTRVAVSVFIAMCIYIIFR
jgi:hypothetical protein